MPPEQYFTRTLRENPWGFAVARVLNAAIQAVDPKEAIHGHMQREAHKLSIDGHDYDLNLFGQIFVVGAGKAAVPMAQAVVELLGDRIVLGSIVTKAGHAGEGIDFDKIEVDQAGHPVPDSRGISATQKIVQLLGTTRADDLVIVLLSGGGSALLIAPPPGVTLNTLQVLTQKLLICGATIHEINTLRKHLDQVKGGNLVRLAAPSTVVSLILSDVVGDPLDVIASGPTVPDPTTFVDAASILDKYALRSKIPESILNHLIRGIQGEISETLKPGDPAFHRVQNVIIGSNLLAARAAMVQAENESLRPTLLTNYLQGEARQVGKVIGAIARQIALTGEPFPRPVCLIAGGETTVTVTGDGLGGRNQEVALGAVQEIAGLKDLAIVTLATDGGDGPTDAAGAIISGDSLALAQSIGLDPADYLACNDAYHFFEHLDDLLKPGPTQTNVNDLTFVFAFQTRDE